jgi:L-ectoine synthase
MIVRSAEQVEQAGHFVDGGDWSSARYLTRSDGLLFSLNDTRVKAGTTNVYEYANHVEACLCIEGTGTVEALATGVLHDLGPGVLYCLDRHDRHRVTAHTDMRLICVFTPALEGTERHDARGAYGASA